MSYTKDEVITKIIAVLEKNDGQINPSVITQKLNWNKDTINDICALFNVSKFSEILSRIPQIKIKKDGHGTAYVQFVQNTKHIQSNAGQEETKMATLKNALSEGLYEKDEALRLALLTAIAGESIFFLGAPGCAKSMLARRIVKAFKADGKEGIKYFETLLNQFSTPEDVFGNISLKGLNGELEGGKEEYRRLTENMLPEADIAFLDEIWKASPAILNTLLTIINERKFHNGSKVQDVPLKALLAASNELPAKDRGLEALYDRFVIRLCISFMQDEDNFFDMIEGESSEFELSDELKKLQISNAELKEWKTQIDKVPLSEEAREVISAIRKELSEQNAALSEEEKGAGESFEVGDRRWKKIARILKTSAFLNDRTEVDLMDCQLIEYCIWGTEKQQKKARSIVEKCIQQNGLDCDTAIEEINDQIEEFKAKVEKDWFDMVKTAAKPVSYKMKDNTNAYKILKPTAVHFADHTVVPYYISVDDFEWKGYTDRKGMLFGANGELLGINANFSFSECSIVNDEVTWTDWWRKRYGYSDTTYSMKIEMGPAKTHRKQKKYSNIAQETLQKKFDKAYYKPIVDEIRSEIKVLKDKKEADAVPFKANLFANQDYNQSLTVKLDEAIRQLEDAEIELGKQHSRYFNVELHTDFSEGDVILKDGTAFSSEEIKSMTEEQKKNVIAVVCIADDTTFAIGVTEKKMSWNSLKEYALHYGDTLPKEYTSNWIIPDKAQLHTIYKNMNTINTSFEALGLKDAMLTSQKYWSASENGEAAAFYQSFDKNGSQDHTTKDHEYAVRAIREWSKA